MVRAPVTPAPIIRGFEPYILEMQVVGNELRATYSRSQAGELASVTMAFTTTESVTVAPMLEVLRDDQPIYHTYNSIFATATYIYSWEWVKRTGASFMSTRFNFDRMGDGILLLPNDVIRIRSSSNASYFVPQWGRAIIKLYYV